MPPQLPLLSPPPQNPESSGLTHLSPRTTTAKLAGFPHTDGSRLQVGAESRARGTGTEHLARRALWETHTARGALAGYGRPLLPKDGGRAVPVQAQGTHQGRPAGYTLAIAACPGSGMVHPQDASHSSCGAPWCPHHRQLSTGSRLTKVLGLDTRGLDTPVIH